MNLRISAFLAVLFLTFQNSLLYGQIWKFESIETDFHGTLKSAHVNVDRLTSFHIEKNDNDELKVFVKYNKLNNKEYIDKNILIFLSFDRKHIYHVRGQIKEKGRVYLNPISYDGWSSVYHNNLFFKHIQECVDLKMHFSHIIASFAQIESTPKGLSGKFIKKVDFYEIAIHEFEKYNPFLKRVSLLGSKKAISNIVNIDEVENYESYSNFYSDSIRISNLIKRSFQKKFGREINKMKLEGFMKAIFFDFLWYNYMLKNIINAEFISADDEVRITFSDDQNKEIISDIDKYKGLEEYYPH
jgi:hypothetical protein